MFCPIRAQCRFVFITNSNSQGALYAWFPLISKSALAAFHNSSKLQLVHMVGRVRGKDVDWSPCTGAPLLSGQPAEKYTLRLSHRPSPCCNLITNTKRSEAQNISAPIVFISGLGFSENLISHYLGIWFFYSLEIVQGQLLKLLTRSLPVVELRQNTVNWPV